MTAPRKANTGLSPLPAELTRDLLTMSKGRSGRRPPTSIITGDKTPQGKEALALHMRTFPTRHELMLWKLIVGANIGEHFQRQPVLHGYIPDFYHPARVEAGRRIRGFIVEVDGGSHYGKAARSADRHKDDVFRKHGIGVLRISNKELDTKPQLAIARVIGMIARCRITEPPKGRRPVLPNPAKRKATP